MQADYFSECILRDVLQHGRRVWGSSVVAWSYNDHCVILYYSHAMLYYRGESLARFTTSQFAEIFSHV